MTADDIVRGL